MAESTLLSRTPDAGLLARASGAAPIPDLLRSNGYIIFDGLSDEAVSPLCEERELRDFNDQNSQKPPPRISGLRTIAAGRMRGDDKGEQLVRDSQSCVTADAFRCRTWVLA